MSSNNTTVERGEKKNSDGQSADLCEKLDILFFANREMGTKIAHCREQEYRDLVENFLRSVTQKPPTA